MVVGNKTIKLSKSIMTSAELALCNICNKPYTGQTTVDPLHRRRYEEAYSIPGSSLIISLEKILLTNFIFGIINTNKIITKTKMNTRFKNNYNDNDNDTDGMIQGYYGFIKSSRYSSFMLRVKLHPNFCPSFRSNPCRTARQLYRI